MKKGNGEVKGRIVLRLFISCCLLILSLAAAAQQPLNLDFEKPGVTGPSRPWGWEIGQQAATAVLGLDSSVTHSGKYSMMIMGKDGTPPTQVTSLVTSLEPYTLKGRTIQLQGWMKTANLTGKAYITVDQVRDSGDTNIIRSDTSLLVITGTTSWKIFTLTVRLHPAVRSINITLNHSGGGIAWFDDMSLQVGGKKINELQVAAPFTNKQMKWLYQATTTIKGVDATASGQEPSYDDLNYFKMLAGDATIIGLGEATHGTGEFFRMKHRVLEYAVKEMGVRVFAIEDHQMVVEKVNSYVLYGAGDARKSMSGMFGVWDNQEVYNMIKWVRRYNMEHPDDKVEFVGIDMQEGVRPLDSLYAFLKRTDPSMLAEVDQLLSGLKKDAGKVYMMGDSIKQVWAETAQRSFDMIFSKRQNWLSKAKNHTDSVNIEWGIQYARLVKQFTRENINPMALYRDKAMAENVSWILSMRKPGTKMIVWAHDVHISRGEHPVVNFNYHNGISMGSWLAKEYGAAYKAFGISTYTGAYRAYPGYTDYSKWISCPAFPGPKGSLDEALHQIALQKRSPCLLLSLKNARQLQWLTAPLPTRFANHVSYEYAYWTRFSIPYQFDGIFFIDKTSPAQPYKME